VYHDLTDFEPILFKKASINKNKVYSMDTGIFTVPVTGLYHFDLVTAVVNREGWFHAGIGELSTTGTYHVLIEGQNIIKTSGTEQTTAISGTLVLREGQKIAAVFTDGILSSKPQTGSYGNDKDGLRHLHFAGFLVAALAEDELE
jgi:hypothetical protein